MLDPVIESYPEIYVLLQPHQRMFMQERLKKLTTLSLPENPPLVIFVYTPTPYIRVLWGAHYSMPSCAQPSPEYGRVLAFVRYIRLGQIPSMVAILKVFLDEDNCDNPEDIGLYQVIMHLTPETPRLPPETGNPTIIDSCL